MVYSKEIVREWLDEVAERAKDHPEWVDIFERCYTDTLDNTVEDRKSTRLNSSHL